MWVTDNAPWRVETRKPDIGITLLGFGLSRYSGRIRTALLVRDVLRNVSVSTVAAPDRPRIGEIGRLRRQDRRQRPCHQAAKALMLTIVGRLSAYDAVVEAWRQVNRMS